MACSNRSSSSSSPVPPPVAAADGAEVLLAAARPRRSADARAPACASATTILWTSFSSTQQPWMRFGDRTRPDPSSNMSPLPTSRSAPPWSRMTFESVADATEKAKRAGMFALMTPVMTFDRRPLRRDDQVDAHRAGLGRDAVDRLLDVARRDHHQVGELVDDDEDERQPLVLALLARARRPSSPRSNAAL